MASKKAAVELASRLRPRFMASGRQPLLRQRLWGAKHLSAWTLYNAGRNYGWPRVYRRLLEHNRRFNGANPALQKQTQQLIRLGLEAPVQFAAQIAAQAQIIMPFLNKLVERATPNVPSFLVAMAKYIVNSQKPVKIMQDLASSAAKRAPSK
ncbi:expressed unknown protein [Seminavis robusta]|uniref:Uncharacterized protein n=1 Tax=Seminavis robusta TaxID=568900 RepID=A0A9N8DLY5_9STRA|nr:expressed unknown protein [Seminavis robusta]|eukprot:Sro205_g086300.1 n/a (152) ;mRNA; r:65478-66032